MGRLVKRTRGLSVDNVCAMNQPYVVDGGGVASHGLEGMHSILRHASRVIAHRNAQVKRTPRFRADSAVPGKHCIDNIFSKDIELVITQSIMMLKGHYSEAWITENFLM